MFDGKTSPKGVDHKIIYEVWSQLFLKKGVGTGKYRKILTGLFLCRDISCSDFHFFKNDIDWGGHSEQHVSHCVEMPTLMPILNVWVWILAPLLIPASCWCVAERALSSIASFPTCFQNRAEVRSWELNPGGRTQLLEPLQLHPSISISRKLNWAIRSGNQTRVLDMKHRHPKQHLNY